MLKEILQIILSGSMTSKNQIANAIGVQMETLDDMLQLLTDKGMLAVSECDSSNQVKCASCPMADTGCGVGVLGQAFYYVTERGKRYAAREQ